ncbi:hypothetical protein L596_015670 [Steinernema carpocapsae]|uniref:Metallo-beta-lactamase domain-containing protein 1 n=2 Tax=Steinernema carpocapsae TaxID=34508 RepID=A0A4U5NFQ4_STECR|nr:hypothetical protein L596_015670 [Steinernema carpocapsae]
MTPQVEEKQPIVPVNAFMPAATVPPTTFGSGETVTEPGGSDWENRMRELSRQLSSLLGTIKKQKEKEGTLTKGVYEVFDVVTAPPPPKAQVVVLREGMAEHINYNQYNFICTITLVEDEGRKMIVDTGLGTDISQRTMFLTRLVQVGVLPPLVNYVVTTHGHADHSGNTNEFPDAIHFQGNIAHHKSKFNFSDLFEKESQQLTANVMLLKTPGHTAEDVSVIVTNVENLGTVGISGDLFIAEGDIDDSRMWEPLAWNAEVQKQSRRLLLCRVDYIVPGHGKMFRVTPTMRKKMDCR